MRLDHLLSKEFIRNSLGSHLVDALASLVCPEQSILEFARLAGKGAGRSVLSSVLRERSVPFANRAARAEALWRLVSSSPGSICRRSAP